MSAIDQKQRLMDWLLKTVFDPENGSVTAGNSSQLSDGASVTLVMSEDKALELGLSIIILGFDHGM